MEENKDMVTEEIESTGEIKIADEVVGDCCRYRCHGN